MDLVKIRLKRGAKKEAHFFKTEEGMPSGPGEKDNFNLDKADSTEGVSTQTSFNERTSRGV